MTSAATTTMTTMMRMVGKAPLDKRVVVLSLKGRFLPLIAFESYSSDK
jgi:hypothetical protein